MKMAGVSELLGRLSGLQSEGGLIYPAGLFPSQRYHPFLPHSREDDNLFFSATIALTLNSHLSVMTEDERLMAETIIENVRCAISLFRNKDGKPTYNFWQTKPSRHFPNGVLMRHLEHFRIPDDADDTALVHMFVDHSQEEVEKVLQLFERHANLGKKQIKNTWTEFQKLRAISTFFGEKMRIEFDAVVMCNTLLLLLNHFDENEQLISDSLKYLEGVINKGHHKTAPFQAAPNYPSTELIIYHATRLIHLQPNCSLNDLKDKLINDAEELIRSQIPPLSKLVLKNALLMRMNCMFMI